jgi:mannose-1-phosphate guanylyltransferase
MRYALILAGGSGTRLWPMSRAGLPKQLIPFLEGRNLLQVAYDRLQGLILPECRFVCAAQAHRELILQSLPELTPAQFLGEPTGRDTLNAIGLGTAVIHKQDPEAVVAVFTADHIITPVDRFREVVSRGFEAVEASPSTLVTFGITPTGPATSFGYLELGKTVGEGVFAVQQFREKPDTEKAGEFFAAGPERFLWNSGMFVWRASTLLKCLERYEPRNSKQLQTIVNAWNGPEQNTTLAAIFPELKKISVDYAVMEPASRDTQVQVAAVPMPLDWLDVGSWPMFAQTCPRDAQGNALAAGKHLLLDTTRTLTASSDPNHLIATIGCDNLIIIHTPDATLVCPASRAESIKELHKLAGEKFGPGIL